MFENRFYDNGGDICLISSMTNYDAWRMKHAGPKTYLSKCT